MIITEIRVMVASNQRKRKKINTESFKTTKVAELYIRISVKFVSYVINARSRFSLMTWKTKDVGRENSGLAT